VDLDNEQVRVRDDDHGGFRDQLLYSRNLYPEESPLKNFIVSIILPPVKSSLSKRKTNKKNGVIMLQL